MAVSVVNAYKRFIDAKFGFMNIGERNYGDIINFINKGTFPSFDLKNMDKSLKRDIKIMSIGIDIMKRVNIPIQNGVRQQLKFIRELNSKFSENKSSSAVHYNVAIK
jgi:hypothetical protein